MSKRFLISAAAIALMAGAGAVNAQGMKNEGAGGGAAMQQTAPSGAGGAGAAPTQKSEGMEHGKAGDMKSSQTEKSPGAMKNQRAEEPRSGGKDMKAEGREGQDKNLKAEGREGRENNLKAEGREGRENNLKAEGREGRDNNMKAEGRDNMGREGNKAAETSKSTTTTTGQAGASAKLSTEQRTKITSVIRNEHVRSVENVNFSLSVGTRVPREGVEFRTLPAEVVTIYPQWRGYKFIVVRDEIVIIDPNTYEIVEIIT
jgi:Protein of unknown function (DUF1236)